MTDLEQLTAIIVANIKNPYPNGYADKSATELHVSAALSYALEIRKQVKELPDIIKSGKITAQLKTINP